MADDDLTVTEAAELLGITAHGVRYLVKRGVLPARRRGPIFLLPRDDVLAHRIYMASKERPGPERGSKSEAVA